MKSLSAETFLSDSRVVEAKQLILSALADHQTALSTVRPPDPARKTSYDEVLRRFENLRGAPLFFPYLGSGFGNGVFVELADASVKYDFISGIGVHYLGHNHPALVEAALDAALQDTVMQGNLQQNVQSLPVLEKLVACAKGRGARLDHCFPSTSGAMANENALKILFRKKYPADRLLAFQGCFTGRTLVLSQVSDKPAFRKGLPRTVAVDYVPFYDPEDGEGSTKRAAAVLKEHLLRYPERHAAMMFELVQGEGGFFPGDRSFFVTLMEMLREHNVSILIDEIQTFGRTSELFAFQHFGLDDYADVVTVGKLLQVCATLFRDDLAPEPGLLSQTFTASTSALFAASAVLDHLTESRKYLGPEGRIEELHRLFVRSVETIRKKDPDLLSGPYGLGAMCAFTPLDGSPDKVTAFVRRLFDAGVIAFIAGSNPARVRFLMPVGVVTDGHVAEVMDIVHRALVESR